MSKEELGDPLSVMAVVYRRSAKDLEMISRYEKEIRGQLRNAERELERIQDKRKAEEAMSAEVIDVRDLNRKEG